MNHLSKGRRGQDGPRHRPASLDLILTARAMRYQWLLSAFARLQARLARFASELAFRPQPRRRQEPAYFQHGGAGR